MAVKGKVIVTSERRIKQGKLKSSTRRRIQNAFAFQELTGSLEEPDPKWGVKDFDALKTAKEICENAGIPIPEPPKEQEVEFESGNISDMSDRDLGDLHHRVNAILSYACQMLELAQLQEEVWESKFVIALENRKTKEKGRSAEEREARGMQDKGVHYRLRRYWEARSVTKATGAMVKRYEVYGAALSRQMSLRERSNKAKWGETR